jgi:hypothetical protein
MVIKRMGAASYRGRTQIEFTPVDFRWYEPDGSLVMNGRDVADFSGRSHHNYILSLSVNEFKEMLKVIADAALADPVTFEEEFGDSLMALVQLQAVAASVRI